MKSFLRPSFLPTADSSRAVVSYWRNDVHLVLVNRLGSLPRNSVVRLTDHLDMAIVVDLDVSNKHMPVIKCYIKHGTSITRFICQQSSVM